MMRRTLRWLVNFEAVFMPALSPSMETGTVVEWKKKVGDLVKENDVFCTIQTDKAVVDYTNTFEPGYLAKIYCENGQSMAVAKTIAVMVDDAADVAKADEFVPEGEEGSAAAATAAPATPVAAAAAAAQTVNAASEPPEGVNFEAVFMPALSPSMETGTVVEWKKKVGDLVKENDVFCTIQTDKAVVDYTNTFEPGYLAKIYCENGQSMAVAKTIAVMVGDAADVAKVANYYPADTLGASSDATAPAAAAPATPVVAAAAPSSSAKRHGGSIDAAVAASGPSVVRIASGLEPGTLAAIAPSGKDGRYVKSDFAGQPGFDYNAPAPARALQQHAADASAGAAAPGKAAPKSATSPAAAAPKGDVYNVVLQASPVFKSVSDTKLLNKLISTMYVPKPKAKAAK
ncbi:dihydrolipoamide acetyltransferase precursorlike protein [Leptomonas seymouri]|uniref:Dihydrolipoamide acetyltransferaselike protein n=1 Tax=Leptomonas seymouri TaxID=5684 RepID=A0A0N1I7L7_LEPSE|nr:dihydrolipoamide acetyltransferase precursorlike protein [Leptomonas seymouri]|eukprot:KPI89563.1 dihydrolipoamide acetyltransferase precursorlike protein [Leptomonas seymouri]